MALSSVDLSSRALLKIGANAITSFEDGSTEAEVAASLYPVVRDALLSAHLWNFATTQREIPKLLTEPIADFSWAFQLPEDCIRVISAGTQGLGRGLVYRISGRQLHTDADSVTLTFISRPDELTFPPFFNVTLIAFLAAEFCIPLTENTSRWQSLRRLAEEEFRRARLIDAQEDTAPRLEDFTLIEGRN
jgi:hypothetical protein